MSDEKITLESAKKLIKDYKKRMTDKYNPDWLNSLDEPICYFDDVCYALLNRYELLEDYFETDDFAVMKNKAKIIYNMHRMHCPSSHRNLWKDKDIRKDYQELISIVKRIKDS